MSSGYLLALVLGLLCSYAEAQTVQAVQASGFLSFHSWERRGALTLVLEFWRHLEATCFPFSLIFVPLSLHPTFSLLAFSPSPSPFFLPPPPPLPSPPFLFPWQKLVES